MRAWKTFAFLRPFTLIAPALGMLSGSAIALGSCDCDVIGKTIAGKMALGVLVAVFLNGASNGINQIFDREIDRVNKPDRLLPSGEITSRKAWTITVLCYFVSLALAWSIGVECGWIVLAGAFFTVAYSAPPLRTKRHWLSAALTIAVARGVLLHVAGWSVITNVSHLQPWFLGAVYGTFLLGAAATKDYADISGDRVGNCKTLPICFGIDASIRIISPFFICPFLLLPLGAATGILSGNPLVLWGLGGALSLWGASVAVMLAKKPEALLCRENHPAWKHMYLMMITTQVGLAVAYLL